MLKFFSLQIMVGILNREVKIVENYYHWKLNSNSQQILLSKASVDSY